MAEDEEYDEWLAGWLHEALDRLLESDQTETQRFCIDGLGAYPRNRENYHSDLISNPIAQRIFGILVLLLMRANFSRHGAEAGDYFRLLAHIEEAAMLTKRGDLEAARRVLSEALISNCVNEKQGSLDD